MFRRKSNNIISRVLVLLMVIMTVLSYLPTESSPVVQSAEAFVGPSVDDLALTAVRNNYEAYTTGTPVDADGAISALMMFIYSWKLAFDTSRWSMTGQTCMRIPWS